MKHTPVLEEVLQRIEGDNLRLKASIGQAYPCRVASPGVAADAPFRFDLNGATNCPEFQFDGHAVRPEFGQVADALDSEMDPWQRTAWMVSSNGWLDGRAPIDSMEDLEGVLRAAENTKNVIG